MDFEFSEQQKKIQEKAKSFAEAEIAPYVNFLEQDLNLRQQIFKKMALNDFLLMNTNFYGNQADYVSYVLALKEIAKVDAGISVAMSVVNMVAEAIDLYGTDEQKSKYFALIKDGEAVPLSFALTEKNAGSDAKKIETTAIFKDNHYILNGAKQFITNADTSKLILVMAKTDINDPRTISCFLLEKENPGFKVIKKEQKLGLLSANLIDFELVNCVLPKEQLLGGVGSGFSIAMQALDGGRLGIAAQSLGIAESAYLAALKYSKARVQFDHPICENQVIAFKLADMYVKLNAGLGLLYKACVLKNNKKDVNVAASVAKLYCTEAANEIVNEALQIYGGYGYIKDNPIERYYRDVRATTLYEGTSEIQRLIISKNILKNDML